MNLRPSGYEPDELPAAPPRDVNLYRLECNLLRKWWRGLDSNQRRRSRQIYSLLPLATREPLHMVLMELAMGIEPATCGLQNRCSAVELRQQTDDTVSVTKRIIQQTFRYVNAQRNSNMKSPPIQPCSTQMKPTSTYVGTSKTRSQKNKPQ